MQRAKASKTLVVIGLSAFGTTLSQAAELAPVADSGDTAWLLSATALVLFVVVAAVVVQVTVGVDVHQIARGEPGSTQR